MHITRIYIDGFKRFTKFDLDLDEHLNVIVGDNETGKSSLLEAIHLVLTRKYDGRRVDFALDPYLFNTARVKEYFEKLRDDENTSAPTIRIEAYFNDDPNDPELGKFKGGHSHDHKDCPGLMLLIEPNERYTDELKTYVRNTESPEIIPVEYYSVHWRSFKGETVNAKSAPLRSSLIDTNLPRAQRGPNRFVSQIVGEELDEETRHTLSLAYRKLRHDFAQIKGVDEINQRLAEKGKGESDKALSIKVDMSARTSWESTLTPHLDDLPLDCVGKGEQCRIQMRVAIAGAEKSRVVLIEEPENHLSHSNMRRLMAEIEKQCKDKHQVIIATHSTFVLNKLGIDHVKMIAESGKTASLNGLDPGTAKYFMKLPGYDTLRLILSKRCILVEGPSDELIVQRAFSDKHGMPPLNKGVDVISVGTAFNRFLEIAAQLDLEVAAVIDNDGDVKRLKKRFVDYVDGTKGEIRICYDENECCKTLEPQLLKANASTLVQTILGQDGKNDAELLEYMTNNKTECALRFFETDKTWTAPEYIQRAVE